MSEAELEKRVNTWVERCRKFVDCTSEVPYVAELNPELEEFLPLSADEKDQALFLRCRNLLEQHLQATPSNLGSRFAALYPFRDGGLFNPCERAFEGGPFYAPSPPAEVVTKVFKYLAGLVLAEQLSDLRSMKFELHVAYLTRNWPSAEEIFRRVALLELTPVSQLHLLRGHFYFTSVFGRRIELEWDPPTFGFEFYWPFSLPYQFVEPSPESCRWHKEAPIYCRPEPIKLGSPAHWLLTAWCSNPRAPKPQGVLPEGPIEFHDPDELHTRPPESLPYEATPDSMRQHIHEQRRDFQLFKSPGLSAAEQERLGKAIEDFRSGILLSPEDGSPYRVLLARALYAMKQYRPAAIEYTDLLANPYQFKAQMADRVEEENYGWEISFSAALSHYSGGDVEAAIAVLDRLRTGNPNAPGAAWWAAKWLSETGRYDDAATRLKSEAEIIFFSPPESWQLSMILALGQIAKEQESASLFINELARRNPSLLLIMKAVVQEHWPTFYLLSKDSQDRWLFAVHQVHADHPTELRPALFNSAIREYGWVVEHELKETLFSPFRQKTQSTAETLRQAKADSGDYGGDFYKYLVAAKPKIAMGAMINEIKSSKASVVSTDQRFAAFIQGGCPGIHEVIADLELVLFYRDIATHENKRFDVSTVLAVAAASRRVLDKIHLHPALAAAANKP